LKKNLSQKISPQKILFVCTGNICRSPTAEAVARHQAKEKNLEDKIIASRKISKFASKLNKFK
jgi:protein-tyrosine-phosphatase